MLSGYKNCFCNTRIQHIHNYGNKAKKNILPALFYYHLFLSSPFNFICFHSKTNTNSNSNLNHISTASILTNKTHSSNHNRKQTSSEKREHMPISSLLKRYHSSFAFTSATNPTFKLFNFNHFSHSTGIAFDIDFNDDILDNYSSSNITNEKFQELPAHIKSFLTAVNFHMRKSIKNAVQSQSQSIQNMFLVKTLHFSLKYNKILK